ncbi:hypothetical protein TNCV_1143641 [Trichonephila clavipes]|nr:hypothetical protein TNCV_1143641 [Trichonephila clavipes]
MDSALTSEAAWTTSMATMIAASLDTVAQIRANTLLCHDLPRHRVSSVIFLDSTLSRYQLAEVNHGLQKDWSAVVPQTASTDVMGQRDLKRHGMIFPYLPSKPSPI